MADWKTELSKTVSANAAKAKADSEGKTVAQEAAERFYKDTVMPALQEFKEEVEKHGFTAAVSGSGTHAHIIVTKEREQVVRYEVRNRISPNVAVLYPFTHHIDEKRGAFQAEGSFQQGNIADFTKEELLASLTENMKDGLRSLSRRQQ